MVSRTATETRKIKCLVVEVSASQRGLSAETSHDSSLPPAIENRLRPSARDLLPWADPYIASLIRKLQDEVRAEREDEQRRAVLVRQESAGDLPLAALLVDAWNDDAPVAHRPFENEETTDSDWLARPGQPR